MEKFEEKQFFPEKERSAEEMPEIEISEEELSTLKIIAQRVGGDFGMEVKIGKPGSGSFFNPEDNSIAFDPWDIKKDPVKAKFVAGHEGSHRAITLHPKELGLSLDEIIALYSQPGYSYTLNAIEDPTVNNWMRKRYPGLEPYIIETYNKQFEKENAVLSTPEVQKLARLLGYWPRFSQYGSQVIRDWHQGRFSEELDPAVGKALKRTIDYARESIGIIPDPQKPSREKKEIITAGQKRFANNTNYIWPEVKKLVEMDFHTEEQRQMMKEFRQKQKELEQKRREMEEAKAKGDTQKQGELEEEIEGLEKELDSFNQLPEGVKKELEEQIDKTIGEGVRQLNKEIEEKQKQAEEAKQRQEELDKEIKDLEEKAQKASGKEKEELEKQLQEKKAEKLLQEVKQKQAENDLKDIQDSLEQIESGQEMPYPEDKLSEETKQELDKLFQKLPRSKKQEYRKNAEEKLKDFEDALNKEMEGKLNKDKLESHQERRKREKAERESEEERKRAEEERKELEKKLEEMRREKMTEYDKAYEETAGIIDSLYIRLKRFLLPERHPKWRKGFPTGSRLDLENAMQAEADYRYFEKLWERKTVPHKPDYRFSILVDLSSSMEGEKKEETFKGVVVLAETLEKLGLQYEIIGFSNEVETFKEWHEKLDKKKRDELASMKNWGNEGTNTDNATELSLEHIEGNKGKNNFILTLTDGQPNNDDRLREILKEARNKKIKTVGCGLGPNTDFVRDYYPASLSLTNINSTEQQKKEGQKDFSEAFADLLEDMIRHPEKY